MSTLSSDDPLLGRTLANFRLERVIGRGGMATVYFGTDVKLNRPVAVKVIDARYRDNPAYAERFIRESQIVATWRHQNILQIYYADDQDGLYYFAMEFVDGLDLRQLIDLYNRDQGFMPIEDVLRIGYAVADALDYAHTHGVIHRDIKPSNVMVAYTGQVLLTDFGLALQMTDQSMGEVFGTPHYMAPEQARRSADAVPQSDVYSLGVILFELLTGQVPFDDESPTSVALMHLTEVPPSPTDIKPDLPAAVNPVILKALEKEPPDRFATCRQMVEALHEALSGKKGDPELLPPLPAIIEQARFTNGESLDQGEKYMTVAERLFKQEPPQGGQRIPAQDMVANGDGEKSRVSNGSAVKKWRDPAYLSTLLWGSALGLLFVILAGGFLGWWSLGFGWLARETPAPQPPIVSIADEKPTATPTRPPPTFTPLPPPILTDSPAAPISELTETPETGVVTVTPRPLPPTVSSTPPPTATSVPVTDPDLLLVFNSSMAFYVANRTSRTIDISPLSFIAINQEGQMVTYAFQANDWFNFRLEGGKCNGLEVIEARPNLRPSICTGFNWVDHPGHASPELFWRIRPDENVNSFQVLWSGQPIQSCPILAGTCAVALP